MNRAQVRATIHNMVGIHLVILRILYDDDETCRWFGKYIDESNHFLCECLKLFKESLILLRSYFLRDL